MAEHVEDTTHGTGHEAQRLQTHDMEIGITDAVQRHVHRDVVAPKPVSQRKLDLEHARPRFIREMFAECMGVFFYVYCGVASTAAFTLNKEDAAYGSLFQVGWAFALGIAFAIIICGPTSGGHFNPAVTISLAYWQGFPWKKVPYYIFAQIFGSFMAGLMIQGQYHQQLVLFVEAYRTAAPGVSLNYASGPGSIFCSFPQPTQSYGYLFLIEFFVDSFLGLVIWAVLDPANPFISPASAPFAIGLAYAVMVWGFADVTISTNLARDLGTRIIAAIWYGGDAFTTYSAIAILVNIPATLFATGVYELVLRDSFAGIAKGHNVHEHGLEGLSKQMTKTGTLQEGVAASTARRNNFPFGSDESFRKGEESPV